MAWYDETVQVIESSVTAENLIGDSGFDNADFSKTFVDEPRIYGSWVTYKDAKETNEISYEVVTDPTRGNVASFTGRSVSWYTSFFAQRIETTAKKGIYKLSFWGKSADGGKVKVFFRTTDASGADGKTYFVKYTDQPADPTAKWRGTYYNQSLSTEWKEYSVEFDFTKIGNTMYDMTLNDAVDATDTDLTNFTLCFQGETAEKNILIDDVKLELVKDLSEPEPEVPVDLVKDAGFDDADFTKTFNASPTIFGEWVTYKDAKETNEISYAVVIDDARGKVASYTGKPASWYTSFFAQRIETTAKKGIYKLSFWGKSIDSGKVKVFIRTTDAGGKDVDKFFIKETGKPSDPNKSWYGSYYNQELTAEWVEYSVEFDLRKTIGSMYSKPLSDALDTDAIDLTDFSICFQGDVADKTVFIDDVSFVLVKDFSDPEEPEEPQENFLKDSGFDSNPDLTLLTEESPECGKWLAYKDEEYEKNEVTMSVQDDADQGKVVVISGKPFSWYTTVLSQRIEGTLPEGIYRISFRGKSADGGSVRTYIRATNEANTNINKFFVKETGKPSDPEKGWYGTWQSFSLTSQWKEYYVDFNLSRVASSMYTFTEADVNSANEVDRTNLNICILGNTEDATAYIDDVTFTKIADISEEDLIIKYDFEETAVPAEWKATDSQISLSKEHFKKGTQSLCWEAVDKATLELTLNKNLTVNGFNSAYLNIYSSDCSNDMVYVEFLNAKGEVAKKATLSMNFKGWRELNRPYDEYENKDNAVINKVRFTYAGKGMKVYLDNMDLNAKVDSERKYTDFLVRDIDYLSADHARLLRVYALGADVVPVSATEEELKDLETLKPIYHKTPLLNVGLARKVLAQINALNIQRNEDGTVSGEPLAVMTLTELKEMSEGIEALAASALKGNPSFKTALNDWVDHIIDQGVLYQFNGLTYSDYTNVKGIPAGFLAAMDAYTEEQKCEIIKAVKWMLEFNLAYAPQEYILSEFSSDYIYNFLPNLYSCAVSIVDQDEAVENMKALTQLLEKASEYAPGGNDILKPDGTGFHHNTQYNNYMYAYNSWVEYISYLKGTSFRINKDAYERIKKAVVSLYIMSTKSEDDIHLFANSMAGRHPLVGGTEITFKKDLFKKLVEVGGDIMGTGIDSELASQYNYFFMEDFYSGVNKADMDGFYQFNYSPAGIYRQDNWVATMRCPTTKFWGGEIYNKTNRFGRYQAHGTLEIMYDGAMENSGFPEKDGDNSTTKETGGWDWNVEAGSTTVHYTSWKEMMPNKNVTDRFDQYSKTTNFAGALAWKDCGMFGAEFDQDDSWGGLRFTPTNLTFKKSVYAFDGMLISLGSNISASGSYSDDMTTATNLFQSIDSDVSGDLIINGETMPAGAEFKINDSSADLWMVTPQGTGYFVPKGNDPIVIKHGEQESPNETGDNVDSPVTVTAAKAYIDHGIKTSGREYVFVAVPATNTTDMAQLAAKMANNGGEIFEIKAQNEKLHALTYKPANVTAYSIFTAMSDLNFGCVKSTGSEMLLMEKLDAEKKTLSLAVANPNLRPKNDETYGWIATPTETNIVVDGEWVLSQDVDGVVVTPQSDNTTMITLTLAEGEPVYIELIDKDAVGIGNVEQSVQTKVYTAGNDVFVVNAVGTAVVYDVTGQAVKTVDVDGTARFTLEQQGCYIVKINDKTEKVMIR